MNHSLKTWWHYYHFESEPPFTVYPLIKEEEMKYFVGRKDDIDFLTRRTGGEQHIKVLITGTAGIGKTSLLCRYNEGKDNFIRFDFRKAGAESLLMGFIVDELLIFASSTDGVDVSDLEEEYHKIISRTTGTEDQLGGGPVPASHSTAEQTTVTHHITPAKAREIGQQAIKRLHAKLGYLTYLFDETDHLPEVTKETIYSLLAYWSFPSPSTAVLTSRNEDANEGWQESKSIERQIFQFYRKLEPLWVPGTGKARELLDVRFDGCFPHRKKWEFPLQDDSTDLIDVLSDGNIREFLRYVLIVLIAGAEQNRGIPLEPPFAYEVLQDEFMSFALNEDEKKILDYLRKTPSAVSDTTFLDKVGLIRSTAQNRMNELKDSNLVTMRVKNQKHIFTTTRKAELLLDIS